MQRRSRPTSWRARLAGATALAATAGLGAGLASPPAGASTAHRSAEVRKILHAARAAILSRSAVRVVSVGHNTSTHKQTSRTVADAGKHWGRQVLSAGSVKARILVTPKFAFFSGNKTGLTTVFGMPADDLARVGSRWVSISKSEPQYKGFNSTAIEALPDLILPTAKAASSVGVRKAHDRGHLVHVLVWKTTVHGATVHVTLEVDAKGPALPVVETERAGSNEQRSVFSHWNEHVRLRPPKHPVPYKSLSPT